MALKCTRFTQSRLSAVGKLVRFPSILFLGVYRTKTYQF